MNLTQILAHVGLGDGQGNTSITRIILLFITLAVILPKTVIALKTGTIPDWTPADMEMLGIAFGTKLVQNHQENAASVSTPSTQ